jgi:hypothetical protein
LRTVWYIVESCAADDAAAAAAEAAAAPAGMAVPKDLRLVRLQANGSRGRARENAKGTERGVRGMKFGRPAAHKKTHRLALDIETALEADSPPPRGRRTSPPDERRRDIPKIEK